MKKATLFLLLTIGLFLTPEVHADTPNRIAGLELGANIDRFKDLLEMDSQVPVRQMDYLSEVETKPRPGFKSGYVTFGNCDPPGQIVKIKLKYEREDRAFFDELLERFKKRFGNTSEYKGDVFRAVVAWKWSFADAQGNRVSLILQHNSEDDEDSTSGNSLKMTMTSALEKQRLCYEKKQPKETVSQAEERLNKGRPDFDLFIPH